MSESPLMVKSKTFALEVIRASRVLREAFYAHGKADFVAKLHIALKECSETEYWLELLIESGYYYDKTILDRQMR